MKKKQSIARTTKKTTGSARAKSPSKAAAVKPRTKAATAASGRKKVTRSRPVAPKAAVSASVSRRSLEPLSELKTFLQKRGGEGQAVEKHEPIIEQSKFFLGSQTVATAMPEQPYELPSGYGDTRIVLQVRDPYWVHAYWEVNERTHSTLRTEYGDMLNASRWLLRVYDITGVSFNGTNANRFFDIELGEASSNWYINVGVPGRIYCVDIGIRLPDGRFITIARSNIVFMPIDGPSPYTDEEWMIVEDDFNRLYGMSVGMGVGLSSGELRRRIKERMESQLSSGALFSGASQAVMPRRERGFWLVVNTEMIVYGATDTQASVSLQGKPIQLREDGTFSVRFALPDGEQVIPVKAVSPDKEEERVITPIVTKRTE